MLIFLAKGKGKTKNPLGVFRFRSQVLIQEAGGEGELFEGKVTCSNLFSHGQKPSERVKGPSFFELVGVFWHHIRNLEKL